MIGTFVDNFVVTDGDNMYVGFYGVYGSSNG